MLPFRNPLVWLLRFRHRRGYGIHSPFAFNLVTQVLYCPGRYYADDRLDKLFPWWKRVFCPRVLARHRLLFRLTNYWQPREIHAPSYASAQLQSYLHAGCRKAKIELLDDKVITLKGNRGRMVIVGDLRKRRRRWRQLVDDSRATLTFDLSDMGVALFLPRMEKQHYIINW